ncbi:hypothetical protein BDZ89DRAFT_438534 [Hymenopellis radicata]|nr:hypothetical protein BDZ89DRAFT_438534 [Hymenopellis radicata]
MGRPSSLSDGVNPLNEVASMYTPLSYAMTDAGDGTEGGGLDWAGDSARRHAADATSCVQRDEHGLGADVRADQFGQDPTDQQYFRWPAARSELIIAHSSFPTSTVFSFLCVPDRLPTTWISTSNA